MPENMLDGTLICTCHSLLPGILGELFIYHTVILLSSIHSILDPWLEVQNHLSYEEIQVSFCRDGYPEKLQNN